VQIFGAAQKLLEDSQTITQKRNGGGDMAKRQGNRILIKMKSSESSHYYHTEKNRQNHPDRLELKKFDPFVRKRVTYREDR
jgi:large subunit ribosomal protein L33